MSEPIRIAWRNGKRVRARHDHRGPWTMTSTCEARAASRAMAPGPRPTDDEMDGIVHELEAAGLLTVRFDAYGMETRTLTHEGAQVARQLAMGDDAAFHAIVDAGGSPARR